MSLDLPSRPLAGFFSPARSRRGRRLSGSLATLVGVLLLTLAACGRPGSQGAAGKNPDQPQPARIVSLAPNITEILFAIGAGDRVVGVTEYCNFPPEAARLPKVGGFVNPNPEVIIALHPELVVATPNVGNRPFVERVIAAGARVEVVQARNVEEIFPAIETIARACGREKAGSDLVARLHADLDALRSRVSPLHRPRVLFCLQIDPLVAAGPGSYPGDLVALAGGENIVPASAGPYPNLSLEEVIRSGPSVIVQSLMDSGTGDSGAATLRSYWEKYTSIPAVREGHVVTISGDLVLRPGPRVVQGVAALIDLLHPSVSSHAGGGVSSRPGSIDLSTFALGRPLWAFSSWPLSTGVFPAGTFPNGAFSTGAFPAGTLRSAERPSARRAG